MSLPANVALLIYSAHILYHSTFVTCHCGVVPLGSSSHTTESLYHSTLAKCHFQVALFCLAIASLLIDGSIQSVPSGSFSLDGTLKSLRYSRSDHGHLVHGLSRTPATLRRPPTTAGVRSLYKSLSPCRLSVSLAELLPLNSFRSFTLFSAVLLLFHLYVFLQPLEAERSQFSVFLINIWSRPM